MDATTFPFRDNFPTLTDTQINDAITFVSVDWYGYLSLWSRMDAAIALAKRNNLLAYLTGWWLANQYPGKTVGVIIDGGGGKPVASKSIGGTSLSFEGIQHQSSLMPLTSNGFGMSAITMIESAPERFMING